MTRGGRGRGEGKEVGEREGREEVGKEWKWEGGKQGGGERRLTSSDSKLLLDDEVALDLSPVPGCVELHAGGEVGGPDVGAIKAVGGR